MAKDELARRRERYTHQAYEHALGSIRRDGRQHGAIPVAAPPQAFLESLTLKAIGRWDPAIWTRDTLGFGIAWVDPSLNSITLGVPTRFLPDVLVQLMPMSTKDELAAYEREGYAEVWGIPGLRYQVMNRAVLLYVPGLSARIEIPIGSADLWEKATLIAKAEWDDGAVFLWDECPRDWHSAEWAFTRAWPERYVAGNRHYHDSRLASDVLRRLPSICAPYASHDLWFNFFGGRYSIEFEWQNSGPPREVLDLLLDPKDGLDVELDHHGGTRPTSYFYTDSCVYARLKSSSGSCLALRHLTYERCSSGDAVSDAVRSDWTRRLELERRYGYPSSEKFLELSP